MGTITLDDGRSFNVDNSFGKLPLDQQQKIIGELKQQITSSVASDIQKGQTVTGAAPVKDEELAYRGSILPLGKTKEGKIVPALPEALQGAAELTKKFMSGQSQDVSPGDVLSAASIGVGAAPVVKAGAGTIAAARELSALEKPAIPESTQALKSSSQAAYKQVEQSGVKINPDAFRGMVSEIIPEVKKAGFDVDIQKGSAAALKRLAAEVGSGASPSLTELDTLRQVAGAAAKSQDANDRRVARIITSKIDDFVSGLEAKDLTGGGDAQEAASQLKQARELWSRQAKSGELDEMFERAANRAPGTPALGLEGQIRNEFKNLANSTRRLRRFSADEQAAIKQVARGDKVQNGLSQLGKFSPTAGFFALLVAGHYGLDALQNPELLAIPAIGSFARYAAGKIRAGQAEQVRQLVRGGKSAAKFFNRRSQLRRGLLGGESVFSP